MKRVQEISTKYNVSRSTSIIYRIDILNARTHILCDNFNKYKIIIFQFDQFNFYNETHCIFLGSMLLTVNLFTYQYLLVTLWQKQNGDNWILIFTITRSMTYEYIKNTHKMFENTLIQLIIEFLTTLFYIAY